MYLAIPEHNRLIKQIIPACILILFITIPIICPAETTTPANVVLNNEKPLVKKLTYNSGTIKFSTTLNQNEEIKIIFSGRKNAEHSTLLNLVTSDKNCIGEHESAISFRENSKYTTSKYFDEKTPWKQPLTYSITWEDKKIFTVNLNGKSISVKTDRKPRYVSIETSGKSIVLEEFLIQKQ
jgi:hypothetical protein